VVPEAPWERDMFRRGDVEKDFLPHREHIISHGELLPPEVASLGVCGVGGSEEILHSRHALKGV